MSNQTSSVVIAKRIKEIIEEGKDTIEPIPLERVLYGDPMLIDKYPSVSVNSLSKVREDQGTNRWNIAFTVQITVQYGKFQDVQLTTEQMEGIAESVEALVNSDFTLGTPVGGTAGDDTYVVFGVVRSTDYRLVRMPSAIVQAARLLWRGFSLEYFQSP